MSNLFFMYKVKTAGQFYTEIKLIGKQENTSLFHCYINQDIFVVATAKKVKQFDFSAFPDKKAITCIEKAIKILEEALPRQLLLFSESDYKKVRIKTPPNHISS